MFAPFLPLNIRKERKIVKIHIFNPEHDIALGIGSDRFTAPHAACRLRADLGFLPALWAEDGDYVLVDDVETAKTSSKHIGNLMHRVHFITPNRLATLPVDDTNTAILPWGWDAALCRRLTAYNPDLAHFMPDEVVLSRIRMLSNRHFAAENLLPQLLNNDDRLIGQSRYLQDADEAWQATRGDECVLKAPWSSSGRGLRYVLHDEKHPEESYRTHLQGWIRNVIRHQGGVMLEPLYRKVKDLGAEFTADADGKIRFEGLSVFKTVNGSYTGNVLASEADKREMFGRYLDLALLDRTIECIMQTLAPSFKGVYTGPFGVDMMIVADEHNGSFLLHPCVELNLRQTMGHAALAVSSQIHDSYGIMSIRYSGKYRLSVRKITRL